MKRWPLFATAARAFLNERVRIGVSASSGSMSGPVHTDSPWAVEDYPCSIQPRGAFGKDTVLGQYTDATMILFGPALDPNRRKYPIYKGARVEEIDGARRKWEVSDDPENYHDVFLAIPVRPAFMSR